MARQAVKQNSGLKEKLIERHRQNIYGRAAILKPLVIDVNAKRRLQGCHTHNTGSIINGADEASFTLFRTTGLVYVWRTLSQAFNRDSLLPTVGSRAMFFR
ncbi:DDE_3 domain-containing protein [Trichonephila clavipes]|nr:DDE_3 domain-containing protein [Trichonephila clavipes]